MDLSVSTAPTTHAQIMDNRDAQNWHGGTGGDNFAGTFYGDTLKGGGGNDTLYGSNGDDWLWGGEGNDILKGGRGTDWVWYDDANQGLILSLHEGKGAGDTYDSIEALSGSRFADEIYGNEGDNLLYGRFGGDLLVGGRGHDWLDAGQDNDTIQGGEGNDTLLGFTGNDTLEGGSGINTAVFSGRREYYTISDPDNGYIKVTGTDGIDTLKDIRILRFESGAGTEVVVLSNSAPTGLQLSKSSIEENAPKRAEVGALSATDVDGDALTYSLLPGSSSAFAIVGNKLVVNGPLDFESKVPHQVTIQADDGFGGKTSLTVNITVTNEVENTPFTLWGTPGVDVLTGENGNDTIYGSGANDVLSGEAGNDWIYGQAGNDLVRGGAGKDVFVFDTRTNKRTNVDRVEDFRFQDDSIYLENKIFTKLGSGTASKPKKFKADMFTTGTKAKDAEDRIVYDKKTGSLYYDQDGTGSKAQVLIATLTNKAALKYHDFFVI
jgi:Ca2+-binding RTX toxin-like protein